jgi:predicted RNA-binding Zn-ribbon protein involved in translation (DUF1610 family)
MLVSPLVLFGPPLLLAVLFQSVTAIIVGLVVGFFFMVAITVAVDRAHRYRCPDCGQRMELPIKGSWRAPLSRSVELSPDMRFLPCCGRPVDEDASAKERQPIPQGAAATGASGLTTREYLARERPKSTLLWVFPILYFTVGPLILLLAVPETWHWLAGGVFLAGSPVLIVIWMRQERRFTCPHCGTRISRVLPGARYVDPPPGLMHMPCCGVSLDAEVTEAGNASDPHETRRDA